MNYLLTMANGQKVGINAEVASLEEFMEKFIVPSRWMRVGQTFINTMHVAAVAEVASEAPQIQVPQPPTLQLVRPS